MAALSPYVSVVVPVYNSAPAVGQVYARVAAVLDKLAPPETGGYEIIFVDDASTDASWQAISQLYTHHHRPSAQVIGLRLGRNVGQHAATLCGLRHSCGQYVATLDDDLQQAPEALPQLLQALQAQNADIVYGTFVRPQRSALRLWAGQVLRLGSKLAYGRRQLGCSFRLIRRAAVGTVLHYRHPLVSLEDIIYTLPLRLAYVPVQSQPSVLGYSRHRGHSLTAYSLQLLLWYTPLPLYALWALAAALLLAAVILPTLSPTPPVLYSLITGVGGLVLAGLGLLGVYLRGLIALARQTPQYVISDQLPA